MRTLTPSALAARAAAAAEPVLVLDLDCGAGGTFRFATRDLAAPVNAIGAIASVSPLDTALADAEGREGLVRVRLIDTDGSLKTLLESEALPGARATIYQHFDALGESDMIPLVSGLVQAGAVWREDAHAADLSVGSLLTHVQDAMVGRTASRTDFPKIAPDEEGRMLPLLYGRPRRVRAVLVKGGAETELVRAATLADTTLIVKDARRFPEGETRIRIHQEEITGRFDGNTFHVDTRGASILSGETTHKTGRAHLIRDDSLPATDDNAYVGLYVRLQSAGRTQTRRIVQYVAATGVLALNQPFYDDGAVDALIPEGTAFEITTVPSAHAAGEMVREVLDHFTYLISDAPVETVDAVEGWGVVEPKVAVDGKNVTAEHRGYITLPPAYYAVNANDTTSFPGLGHAVATIRLPRLPAEIADSRFLKNELFVTARGLPGTDGTAMENPADIMQHLLTDLAGVSEDDMDAASFAFARTARSDVTFAFSLDKPRRVGEVLADLAFQARLALLWESGTVKLRALSNALGASAATLDGSGIELASGTVTHTPEDEVVTEIVARYTYRAERAAVTVSDPEAESRYGRRVRECRFWAFEQRPQVLQAAEWWLRRWRHRYRLAQVTTFLNGVDLERDDTVTLDHDALSGSPVAGRVTHIEHAPGRLAEDEIDRVRVDLRLPLWGGCASACEHACESTACESASCELSCTTGSETGCEWTCEVNCEEACELSCTATCELSCQATCMVACRAGGESAASCGTSCETGCETSCESFACESQCESCCEVNCESAASETVSPIREVLVLTAPASPGGAASVVECTRCSDAHCESFTAYDPFDVRPAAGSQCTVYLNFNFEWVIVPGPRDVKYVRVQSDAGSGRYAVVEQNHEGETWGEPFYAWAVDSV